MFSYLSHFVDEAGLFGFHFDYEAPHVDQRSPTFLHHLSLRGQVSHLLISLDLFLNVGLLFDSLFDEAEMLFGITRENAGRTSSPLHVFERLDTLWSSKGRPVESFLELEI